MNQLAPLKTFIVYSSKDRELRDQLESHLRALVDMEWISLWSDKEIAPGERWDKAIKDRLLDTEIFLMLVSVDFYNSGYIREEEFKTAMGRLKRGDSMVIPIIVRPCDWESYPIIKDLQVLPPSGHAVTDTDHWKDRDKAWQTIARKLRERIQDLRAEREAAFAAEAQRAKEAKEAEILQAHNTAWTAASDQHIITAYEQFLAAYPDSTNAREARNRIKMLLQVNRQPVGWGRWAGLGVGILTLAFLVWLLNRSSDENAGTTLSRSDATKHEEDPRPKIRKSDSVDTIIFSRDRGNRTSFFLYEKSFLIYNEGAVIADEVKLKEVVTSFLWMDSNVRYIFNNDREALWESITNKNPNSIKKIKRYIKYNGKIVFEKNNPYLHNLFEQILIY